MHRKADSLNAGDYAFPPKIDACIETKYNRFCTWKDLVITPFAEFVIVVLSVAGIAFIGRFFTLGIADCLVLFLLFQGIVALIFLKVIRILFPLKEGTFRIPENDLEL